MSGYVLVSLDLGQLMHNRVHKKNNNFLIVMQPRKLKLCSW